MQFYRLTGDRRYLARIPEAIDWLESLRLPPDPDRPRGRDFPTFIEIGTNRAMLRPPARLERRQRRILLGLQSGSDARPLRRLAGDRHSPPCAAPMTRRCEIPPEEARRTSPLASPGHAPLPRFYVTALDAGSDLNAQAAANPAEAVRTLNAEGWWPTPLRATSNPYIGPGPRTPPPGDFRTTHVGDSSDTSPYRTDRPVIGISTATYIANMVMLIEALNRRPN